MRNFTALASYDASYLFAGSSSSDFTAVHVKHKDALDDRLRLQRRDGVIAQQSPEGDRFIVGCGDGSISVFDGQRNGAQTCRTHQRGPTESRSVGLDGSVSAMQLHACNEETGELAAGGDGQGDAVRGVVVADHRSIGAPAVQMRKPESHHAGVVAVAYPRDRILCDRVGHGTVRVGT